MFVIAKANILTVGINNKAELLRRLPIRVVTLRFGADAVRSLKIEKVDSVISKWDLDDMKDGKFLRGLKSIRPDIPTIAIVEAGNYQQEISARSIGVSAVLTEDVSDDNFLEIVCGVLGIEDTESIKTIHTVKNS